MLCGGPPLDPCGGWRIRCAPPGVSSRRGRCAVSAVRSSSCDIRSERRRKPCWARSCGAGARAGADPVIGRSAPSPSTGRRSARRSAGSEELGGQRCPRDARPDERPHGGEGRGGLGESHDARPDLHVAGSLGQLDVPARRRGDRGRSGRPRGPDRVVSCRLVSKGAGRRRRATAAQRSATVILEAHEDAGGPRRAGGPLHEHAFADGGSGPPPRTGERARLRASGPVRPPEPRPAPTPPSGRRSCATRSGPRSTRRGRTGGPRRRP